MLVDNAVNGDSRVQKTAISAAAAGWDVVLLGRSPNNKTQTWQLGGAEVRLLPMPTALGRAPHEFRRPWVRGPLAYPPTGVAARREQEVRAWRADVEARLGALSLGKPTGARGALSRQVLRGELLAAKVSRKWVGLRWRQLNRAQEARKQLASPVDKLYTLFWQKAAGDRSWRRLEPGLWDFELAYGPVIDKLKPDLIHANDFRMLGVGARAKLRAAAKGRRIALVWDAHEFLPGVRQWHDSPRWLPANTAHEREYAPYADAVLTVSDGLADLLREGHHLPEQPTVVLNTPSSGDAAGVGEGTVPDIRELCGIGPEVPLLVYSGAAAAQRGLGIMVDGLAELTDAHVAFVVPRPAAPYIKDLQARAAELGVAGRVHVLPYVPHHQVVPFLSGAQVGVIPIHHWPNHEIALITKFFEYSHARLPLVVSDVKTMSETVRQTGQGEVFTAEDVADFVRAVREVLADPARYRSVYDRAGLLEGWTWEAQAEVLDGVYARLLPDAPARPAPRPGGDAVAPVPA
ncbi:glycosyltransferase family 4 protein [Micromonospora sp. NPDC005806]|uniref:glycosyltransferase family 4 protein n=1 Tax=Micromonospora sp. NPDC005806 TaxID=3364234 RepID=UPI003686EAB2